MSTNPINPNLLWIHCNRCYENYVYKKRAFFLLACQHVYCEQCCKKMCGVPNDSSAFKCPLCNKNVRGRQIGNNMPTNLKELFHPEPWHDGLNHYAIEQFQKAHIEHYEKHIMKVEQYVKKLERDTLRKRELCKKNYLELEKLRNERKQLERRVRGIKAQRQREEELRKAKRNVAPPAPPSSTDDSFLPHNYSNRGARYSTISSQRRYKHHNNNLKQREPDQIDSFMVPPNHSFNL